MTEKERITITIEDLDNIQKVLESLQLLFSKLVIYYSKKDESKLMTLVINCGAYFGKLLVMLGYNEDEELE